MHICPFSPIISVDIADNGRVPSATHNADNVSHRIAAGDYYEAHQQLRTIAARYVKSQDWDGAFDILHGGALALLKAGQGGSGGDLSREVVDVLGKGEKELDATTKGMQEVSIFGD